MPLQFLLTSQSDCSRVVFSFLTRRQALLLSATCKIARRVVLEMLEQRESPFRPAIIVACSSPGRLIEVDLQTGAHSHGNIMWNTWAPAQQRCRKRRRGPSTCRIGTRAPSQRPAWMTGITNGPPAWEPMRHAAEASAESLSAPAEGSGAARVGVDGGDPRALRRRPPGPVLYASCYSVPGIVAFDATTLLPLGVLIAFNGRTHPLLKAPEGICSSHDSLFVVNCVGGTVARIGLQPAATTSSQGGFSGAKARKTRYGGALSYGHGVILATISAGEDWILWGLTISPDRRALYCAADLPYNTRDKLYTRAPPPKTTGNVLCVPLECLNPVAITDGTSPQSQRDDSPGKQMQQRQLQLAPPAEAATGTPPAAGSESTAVLPYAFVRGDAALRRPSGLCFSADGASLWVTSYDEGIVEIAGPARGELAGTVLRVVPLPLPSLPQLPPPAPPLPQPAAPGDDVGVTPEAGPRPGMQSGSQATDAGGAAVVTGSSSCNAATTGRGRRRRPNPRVMLPWDVCWLPPQVQPAAAPGRSIAGCSRFQTTDSGDVSTDGAPSNGTVGSSLPTLPSTGAAGDHRAARQLGPTASLPPSPLPLLCVTLHEDPSTSEKVSSGADCRVGVLTLVARGTDGKGVESGGLVQQGRRSGGGGGGASVAVVGPLAACAVASSESGSDRGEEAAGEEAVAMCVRARWRSTREHSHPSMMCTA